MKNRTSKIVSIVFFLCLTTGLLPVKAEEQAVISGKVAQPGSGPVKLRIHPVPFLNQPMEMSAVVDSNGNFQFKFALPSRHPMELMYANTSVVLFVQPADSFFLSIDTTLGANSIRFSGKGYEESAARYQIFKNFDEPRKSLLVKAVSEKDETTYLDFIRQQQKDLEKTSSIIFKNNKTPKAVKERIEKINKTKIATYLLAYSSTKSQQFQVYYPLPKSYADQIRTEGIIGFDYADDPDYQSFLFYHLSDASATLVQTDICTIYEGMLKFTDTTYAANAKEFLQARLLYEAMERNCAAMLKPYLEKFRKTARNEAYRSLIENRTLEFLSLEQGQPAPDFDFVDKDGQTHRLSEYKGKVIYLDFWATWCGPCIRGMQTSKPMKAKFKDNSNVVFLYVSTDQDQAKWKNHQVTNSGEGVYWHVGANAGRVSQTYKVQYIPRYVLIDKNGNLVNANAPHPDDPSLETLLKDLSAE